MTSNPYASCRYPEPRRQRVRIIRRKSEITDSSSIDAVSFSVSNFQFAKLVQSIGGYKPTFPIPKRSQLFIGAHNKAPSVVAMCICNPVCSPAAINR
jgi:hypothetical protein